LAWLASVFSPEPYELKNLVGLLAFGHTGIGIAHNPLFGIARREDASAIKRHQYCPVSWRDCRFDQAGHLILAQDDR
jgi:hypothetical protein